MTSSAPPQAGTVRRTIPIELIAPIITDGGMIYSGYHYETYPGGVARREPDATAYLLALADPAISDATLARLHRSLRPSDPRSADPLGGAAHDLTRLLDWLDGRIDAVQLAASDVGIAAGEPSAARIKASMDGLDDAIGVVESCQALASPPVAPAERGAWIGADLAVLVEDLRRVDSRLLTIRDALALRHVAAPDVLDHLRAARVSAAYAHTALTSGIPQALQPGDRRR